MSFNRSQFKAPSLAVNKEVSARLDTITKSKRNTNYLSIDEGMNIFRLFPPHDSNNPTFQPRAVYWIECNVQKRDSEGNPIEGEREWRLRPVLDSRVHGDTKRDIIDEYIKFTRKTVFSENQDKEDVKKKLAPISGWRGKDGKWVRGIGVNVSYLAYATKGDIKIDNFGILEIWSPDKAALEALNIDEVSGEVIQTDIFSGPNAPDEENGGYKFCINLYRNAAANKWERAITKFTFKPTGRGDMNAEWKNFNDSQRIPDEVLEHWSKMPSLAEQYENIYKRSDFLMAIEALEKFDKENGYNTFSNPDFIAIVNELDALYPEEEDEPPFPDAPQKPYKKVEEEEDERINFKGMSRDELKKFIKENNLHITVYKNTSTEDIAAQVEEEYSKKELFGKETQVEEEDDGLPFEIPASASNKPYNYANAKKGEVTSSVDAGAGKDDDFEELPWSEEDEKPSPDAPKTNGLTLRERLAQIKSNQAK